MVNAVSMDNVEHAYAVQQLRKSGKIAKIVSVSMLLRLVLFCGHLLEVNVNVLIYFIFESWWTCP